MLLVDYLLQKFPLAKRQTLKRMVEQRRVTINGKPATRLKLQISDADQIEITDAPRNAPPSLHPLKLIHEDPDLMVVIKPPGLLTSTTPREKRPTAIAIIREYLSGTDQRARPGVIHRLDADASGLLVFSKNSAAFEHLKRQFARHTVDRIYLAVVHGRSHPPHGKIESRLLELPTGKVVPTKDLSKGDHAVTHYKTLKTTKDYSLLEVQLETGRKHQIRSHLAEVKKTPIVGDPMYGDSTPPTGLLLCAIQLAFDHPRTTKRMTFRIRSPAPISKMFPE